MRLPRPVRPVPSARLAAVALAAVALAACGGGGGGDDGPTLLSITAANQETVSHATATGALALGSAGAVPLTAQSAPGDRAATLAIPPRSTGGWTARVIAALTGRAAAPTVARAGTKRALALIGPVSEDCDVSGSVSVTLDDRDGNGDASFGDVLRFDFDACVDVPGERIDGTVEATLLSINDDGSALSADFALADLSATSAGHTLVLDGTLRVDYSTPGTASPVDNLVYTARGPFTVRVSTPLPYNDTVTLLDGWRQTETYDASVAPVAGNVEPGRSVLRIEGSLRSAAAGSGTLTVSTPVDIVAYGEDLVPRQGVLLVQGLASALRLTVLSTDSVRIELDANGDGVWEASRTETWDWLL